MIMFTSERCKGRTFRAGIAGTLLSALALVGCSGGENDGGASSPTDFVQGTWFSACHGKLRQSITFSGIEFRIHTIRYGEEDDSCTGRVSRATRNAAIGRFVVGEGFITSDGLEAVEVDFVYDRGIENRQPFSPAPYEAAFLDGSSGIMYLGLKAAPNGGWRPSERPVAIDFGNGYSRSGD